VIQGYATVDATKAFAQRHHPLSVGHLGTTGLTVSQAGFGCYRVSTGVPHHKAAFQKSLRQGINLIDTSSNYADGGSESLVGEVLEDLITSADLSRENIVVVSKIGYLQGHNYELSRRRKQEGRPFPELVEYGEGLEHCIHPQFLKDQLNRSLDRLKLKTLDFCLLHNPEYYLEWAQKNGHPLEATRAEYYRRIRKAFEYLEEEVVRGRIRYYGISSNTFPAAPDQPDFTCLATVWGIAESLDASHHFRLIQLPLNLMEPGAVLEKNQPDSDSVLEFARHKGLGVLINRPLNAFYKNQLIRLAQAPTSVRQAKDEIVRKIQFLSKSEKSLWMKFLPAIDAPPPLRARIKEQIAVGDILKHHWLNFGTYENWRQVEKGNLRPRIEGVMDFMAPYGSQNEDISNWITSHQTRTEEAFDAVTSIYAEEAARRIDRIRRVMAAADPDWAAAGTLSQKAVRAVRSTHAVSCVLVGMRREEYVSDILAELRRPIKLAGRLESWQTLSKELANTAL
jgi:aryl-alcohol dehydrogenase-like predicted oxidoreductase